MKCDERRWGRLEPRTADAYTRRTARAAFVPSMTDFDRNPFGAVSLDLLHSGHPIRFRATGSSMYPTIRDGDFITVEPLASGAVRTGDIVMYTTDERFVVHRVVALRSRDFVARGDALPQDDPPASLDRLLGRVVAVEPKRLSFVLAATTARLWGRVPGVVFRLYGRARAAARGVARRLGFKRSAS